MTQDEIIEMANKAYAIDDGKPLHPSALFHLEIFAKLVANKERKSCADLCDKLADEDDSFYAEFSRAEDCARKIRARGEA